MRKSDIFEEFIKIAQERKIMPTVRESTRENFFEDREEQEHSYNLKLDNADDATYEYNIVEIAHPKPVVVSPAYDKVNGLVENINERSSIMQDIATRTPRGNGFPKKYAEKQLLMSLVRIANDLDNSKIEDLQSLADTCLIQTSKQIKKQAIAPLAIAGILGAAAIIGGLYAKQHMAFFSDGFERDHEKLLAEINDIVDSSSNFGVGKNYSPAFLKVMESLQKDCNDFYSIYKIVLPVLEKLNEAKTGQELMEQANKGGGKEVEEAYKKLKAAADNLIPKLLFLQKNLVNNSYKNMQVQEKGWLTDIAEKSGLIGGKGVVADDMDDVSHALETYIKDIRDLEKILRTAGEYQENAKRKLEEAAAANQEAEKAPTATQENAEAPRSAEEIDKTDLQKELDSFDVGQ